MNTQSNVVAVVTVSAVDSLKAQIAALKAQAKEVAKAEKVADRAAVKELNKLHAEALKINAQFDKGVAELNKIEAAKMLQEVYDALVVQLAAAGLTVADFKSAMPKLAVAKTEAV